MQYMSSHPCDTRVFVKLPVSGTLCVHLHLMFPFHHDRVTYYAEFLPQKARGYCLVFVEVSMYMYVYVMACISTGW